MANQDPELQDVLNGGKLKRERIDANVELLLETATKGNIQELQSILDQNKHDQHFLQQHDANKRTALHFAAHKNNTDSVKLLLKAGADGNAKDWEGMSPLMYALKTNSVESAKLLLEVPGVDLSVISEKGITLLHTAVMNGNKELARLLIEKGIIVMPRAQSESGSVLHFAVTDVSIDLASLLIQHEPKLANSRDENFMTPLHLACAYNNETMALFLIENGADVNAIAIGGTTPLHIAADCGNKKIVASLISHGAVQKLDSTGHTPAMAAVRNKTTDIEELLKNVTIDIAPAKADINTPADNTKISAEQLKESGNKAFGAKDYEMAIHWYSLAIEVDSILCETCTRQSTLAHVLFSNRSAAYYHEKQFKEALDDANKTIQLAPDWPKGYLRKGHALTGLGEKDQADIIFAKMKELENKV